MTFDQFWEKEHSTRQWGKYPNEQFVRFMLGNYKNVPDRKAIKVLEIGSGGGANLAFVAKEGFSAYGLDASPSAVKNTQKFFAEEDLQAELVADDANNIENIFPGVEFDVILDICTLSHIQMPESTSIVERALKRLKPGGGFFSITFAVGTWGEGEGKKLGHNCWSEFPEGPLRGIGVVQLMDLPDIEKWAAKLSTSSIEEMITTMDNRRKTLRYFLLTGRK